MATKWDKIVDDVCAARRVFKAEVLSRKRYRPLVAARYEIAWRIANETKLNSTQIGLVLGRHRSSVLHGLQKMGCFPQEKPVYVSEVPKRMRRRRVKAYRAKSRDWVVCA